MAESAGTVTFFLDANSAKLFRELQKASRRTERTARKMQNTWKQSFDKIRTGARLMGSAIAAAVGIRVIKSIIDAGLSMQRIERALKVATGSAATAQREFQFLADTSLRLGLDLESSALAFGRLAAAAQGTVLAGQAVRDIFTGVAQASVVLGLTTAQTSQGFVALEQIMSKGKLQAEEIRKQLGNVLPGAFRIAARAMKMTTAELDKMLSLGKITAEEFFPALSEELERLFGPASTEAAKSAEASIGKLKTSIFLLKNAIAQSGVLDAMTAFNEKLAELIRPATAKEELVSDVAELVAEIAALQEQAEKADVPFWENVRRGFSTIPRGLQIAVEPVLDTTDLLGTQLATSIRVVATADISEVLVIGADAAQKAIEERLPDLEAARLALLKDQTLELRQSQIKRIEQAFAELEATSNQLDATFIKDDKSLATFVSRFETAEQKVLALRTQLDFMKRIGLPEDEFIRIGTLIDDIESADLNKFLSQFETSGQEIVELRAEFEGFKDQIKDPKELERIEGLINDIANADLLDLVDQFETSADRAADLREQLEKATGLDPAELVLVNRAIDEIERSDLNAFLAQFDTVEQSTARLRLELESFKDELNDPEEFARISKLIDEMADKATVAWDQAARNMQDALADFFMFADSGFKGLVESMLKTIQRMLANSLAAQFMGFLKGIFSPAPTPDGGGEALKSFGSSAFGFARGGSFVVPQPALPAFAGGGSFMVPSSGLIGFARGGEFEVPDLPKFAMGGDFIVGGAGGGDNQLVQFMATAGERVTITPAGQAGDITVVNNIDASGADADRILSMLPAVMEQTSDQTVARIRDLQARGRM
jgi:tape measure domain-containing protein